MSGQITRSARKRSWLRAATLVTTATLLLSACGSDGEEKTERADGGTATVYTANIKTLDPRQNHGVVNRALADSLIDIDPETFEFKPWLATEWSQSANGQEFTFTLRQDVTFSDGTPLNAEAVRANFDGADAAIKDGKGWYIQGLFDNYVGTDIASEYQAVVKFSKPNPAFLPTVATDQLAILSPGSFKKSYEARQNGDFSGSGPFVLDSYTPNEQITLKRREDYNWASGQAQHTGKASIETFKFNFVDEQSVRENALLSGEIQLAQNPTIEGTKQLEAQDFTLHYRAQSGNPYSLVGNFGRELTRDIAVRRALSKAIDRDSITTNITGKTEPTSTSVLTPATFGYANQSKLIGFDLEGAKKILEQDGWVPGSDGIREKNGKRLSLVLVNWWEPKTVKDALTLLKEQAAKAGIEINLVNETAGGSTWSDGKGDFLYNNATRADGGLALYSQYIDKFLEKAAYAKTSDITEPGSNLNDILVQQISEPDAGKRKELLSQAQEIIVRDAVRIPIFDNVNSESGYFAAGPKVKGLWNNSLSELVIYDAWIA